jgi:uncharacterized cupredoxin-like copper-binding protein
MELIERHRSRAVLICVGTLLAAAQALADSGPHSHEHEAAPAQKSWGTAAAGVRAARTIEVAMGDDMRFIPDRIEIRQGDVVKFTIRNHGRLPHEMVIGTERELKRHAAEMAKMPAMGHVEPGAVRVEPGAAGELVWNFNRPGSFHFACLVPGHLEAGMAGVIVVAPAKPAKRKS